MKRILILITLLFATQQVYAVEAFQGGKDLQKLIEQCSSMRSGKPTPDASWSDCGYVSGYIAGVSDSDQASCTPDELSFGQLRAVVENWLKSHPEDWHFTANSLILIAVNEAWPCPE